jgi:pyruvate,water dikinase
MFTANPLNGKLDELVINAAWGLGEAVVGGAVNPDTLVVEKDSCSVIDRDIARKLVQTVRTNTGTEEQPVPVGLQNIPVLEDKQASELAELGVRIEKLYSMPMDIEWTLKDGVFSIVQARPITALPDPPIEWVPPDPKGVYMRASVVDLMPDPVSPLFETLGIPTLMEQMKPLGTRMTRSEPVLADDYFTTINGYAYMNASMPPKAWWWILTGLFPSYPKLLTKLVPMWRDELHPEYRAFVESVKDLKPSSMSAGELWKGAQETMDAAMYYVCALMFATMGASAGSEMLLTKAYDKLAKQEGDPPAAVLLMGWDNIPIRSEKSLYDLAGWCQQHRQLTEGIIKTPSKELADHLGSGSPPGSIDSDIWREFQERFFEHMDKFGHIIFQLDFASDLPLDHPEPMLETIKMYLRGGGIDPHERQKKSEETRIQTVKMVEERLSGIKLWLFRKALRWGQSLAEVREDALADIGLGYPKLREMLFSLGQRLAEAGVVAEAEDILWLEKEEIDGLINNLASNVDLPNLSTRVVERKVFWEKLKGVAPPPMMPIKDRVMGVKSDVFISHTQDGDSEGTLSGVPASAGVITAPACVLHGPEDFELMRPGDVLVAGTTTPAWTPLFAMASAVVTDIGGPLSHGSIVAREYGIPAVMGTGEATQRIKNGQTITVDGGNGTVEILEETGVANV